jgi:hypothetical protein
LNFDDPIYVSKLDNKFKIKVVFINPDKLKAVATLLTFSNNYTISKSIPP